MWLVKKYFNAWYYKLLSTIRTWPSDIVDSFEIYNVVSQDTSRSKNLDAIKLINAATFLPEFWAEPKYCRISTSKHKEPNAINIWWKSLTKWSDKNFKR